MTFQYKQYRIRNKKAPVTEFKPGSSRYESKKNKLNDANPLVPHWIEYRLVDVFEIPKRPELVIPLNGEKQSALCCRCFSMKYTPDAIESAYMNWSKWKGCIDQIAPMLIHVAFTNNNPLRICSDNARDGHFYTCKHLDRKEGDCLIYDENRPNMCHVFPRQKFEIEMCDHCATKDRCNGFIEYEKRHDITATIKG